MNQPIGVIGQGFVGGTLTTVFSEHGVEAYAYDKAGTYVGASMSFRNGRPNSVRDLVIKCETELSNFSNIYFVCVPTPKREDGAADLSIVESVLKELVSFPGHRIAVIKSTVPPGSCEEWNTIYNSSGLEIIFNPEFLTEANALNDMRNQSRIVLGGKAPAINDVYDLYHSAFPNVPILKTSNMATAEMIKYFTNLQLAVRVILSCEMSQICDSLNQNGIPVDYNQVVEYAKYDVRLGNTHMNVPGKDGLSGVRGSCFPKDMAALIYRARELGANPTVLESAWNKNLEIVSKDTTS